MEKKRQDIRLNKDYRTAYIKDFRRFLESKTDNPKYDALLSAKTLCKTRISEAHKTAKEVVTRLYKPVDVADLKRLQKKIELAATTIFGTATLTSEKNRRGDRLAYLKMPLF